MSSESAESEFTILNQLGLHARAAAQLVQLANRCKCDVTLKTDSDDSESVNGKSIMGVLMLAAAQGQVLTVSAVGPGAADCVREIGELIANRFGEAQ
ncbi:MAG: HPr family phosphocarrier protein [Myxococcaceae bacterium]|jgi:phosphocarrier protein|nr:MAG: HPr family phosphocarrier protein [Myxococcaceae bacterium]